MPRAPYRLQPLRPVTRKSGQPVRRIFFALLGLLGACTPTEPPPDSPTPSCWTVLDEPASLAPWRAAWTTVGEISLDDQGVGGWVDVPLGTGTRGMALRVTDASGKAACVQLQEVRDSEGGAWVTPPASLEDYGP